jgi:organic radical activating enzyme
MLTQVIEGRQSNILTIELTLGNLCNYKCSYCFPGSNEGDKPWPNVDILIKNISHLFDTYKKKGKNKFELYIVGGEPTLWKDLSKFCIFLKNNYNTVIRISTNGYRKSGWWKENSKLFDAVEVSVHHEFADPAHINTICDVMYEENTNLVANVLMDPMHFDKCKAILEHLKSSKRRWPIVAKWVHFVIGTQIKYTDDQKNYLKDPLKRWPNLFWWYRLRYNDQYKTWVIEDGKKKKIADNYIILHGKNKFQGWSCNLGLDHLHVSMVGRLSGNCGQLIYGESFYYNLYDVDFSEKFNPIIGPVTCSKHSCNCGFESNLSKIIPIKLNV